MDDERRPVPAQRPPAVDRPLLEPQERLEPGTEADEELDDESMPDGRFEPL
jgi:hypothetical protein